MSTFFKPNNLRAIFGRGGSKPLNSLLNRQLVVPYKYTLYAQARKALFAKGARLSSLVNSSDHKPVPSPNLILIALTAPTRA